jgi:glutamine synthetase
MLDKQISDIQQRITTQDIQFIDLRFYDLLGRMQHITLSASEISPSIWQSGYPITLNNFNGLHAEKSLRLKLNLGQVCMDPFYQDPTLAVDCQLIDASFDQLIAQDTGRVIYQADQYLKSLFPSAQFKVSTNISGSIFDEIDTKLTQNQASVHCMSATIGGGQAVMPPSDADHDLRAAIALTLKKVGLTSLTHQALGNGRHAFLLPEADMISMVHHLRLFKHVFKNVAHTYGKAATFLPFPSAGHCGNHLQIYGSLTAPAGQFSDKQLQGFFSGIVKHLPALNAWTNPTTNSYRRLAYLRSHASMPALAMHIDQSGLHFQLNFPDPLMNPALAFSAILLAGVDGMQQAYPIKPDLSYHQLDFCDQLSSSLVSLKTAAGFLRQGEPMAFSDTLLASYTYFLQQKINQIQNHPHPAEFIYDDH